VAVERSVFLRRTLVTLSDLAVVDDQVVVVLILVDTELAEGKAGKLPGFLLPFKGLRRASSDELSLWLPGFARLTGPVGSG